jgi:hypothetical protein
MKSKGTKFLSFLAIILLSAQFLFWNGIKFNNSEQVKKNNNENAKPNIYWVGSRSIKPEIEVVPATPSVEILKAFSFGDEQLSFRYNGYMMQFLGDSFGRVTPLKDYNYERLYRWWSILDEIDSVSNLVVYVAAYYYSASQDVNDIPYVVDFLEKHSDKHPSDKWWWYSQAVYLAKNKMKDDKRALEIAKKLSDLPKDLDIPIWTRQLQAFIFEGKGEYKQACDIIVNVIRDSGDNKLTEGEMNFIYYFIQERLRAIIEKESSIEKADISPECRAMMEIQKAQDLIMLKK